MPAKVSRAGVSKVAASIIARKLMREVKAKPGAPVWRTDESGKAFTLVITRAGRKAVDECDGRGDDDRTAKAEGSSEQNQPEASAKGSRGK